MSCTIKPLACLFLVHVIVIISYLSALSSKLRSIIHTNILENINNPGMASFANAGYIFVFLRSYPHETPMKAMNTNNDFSL